MTQLTLKMLRVRNNWTQEQAAKKVGVSKESRSWYQVLKEQDKKAKIAPKFRRRRKR